MAIAHDDQWSAHASAGRFYSDFIKVFVVSDVDIGGDLAAPALAFELADEIWVVLDADIARLTRLFLIESAPGWWLSGKNKVKIIANKWNAQLARTTVLKKVEGTLSLWGTSSSQVDYQVPLIDQEKAAAAHVKANFLLELFPEEESEFQSLMHVHKGRML